MKKSATGANASVSAPTATATTSTAAPSIITAMNDSAVESCITLLGQVATHVGSVPALDGNEIRRATKMRKGGAGIIPQLLALCAQKGVTQIGALTTQEMSDQLKRGDALVQVGKHAGVVQKQVREAGMSAHGRSWQIATTMYTTLQRLAVDDPELALGLEPVQEFFRTKRTKGKVREDAKASDEKKLAKETGEAPVAPAAPVTPTPTATH